MKRRNSASSIKERGIEMEDQGNSIQKLKDAAKKSESVKFSDEDPVKSSKPNICTRILKAIWRTRWTEDFSDDRESYVRTTLRELAIYIVFIVLLVIITFVMTSSDTYYFTKVMQDLFLTKKFEDIGSQEDFWKYINADDDGLMSGLYWPEKYNGEAIKEEDQGYIYYENKLLGSPRIRQVRVRKNSCKVHERFTDVIDACYATWSMNQEDKEPLKFESNGSMWMNYSTSEQLESRTTYGKLTSVFGDPYSGGGVFVDLPRIDKKESARILKELQNLTWVGRGTRAVMIDFTVYNANVNLFSIIKLIFEFPASGGCFPHSNFQTLKLIRYVTPTDKFVQICEYIYVVFILYYIIEEAFEIHKHKVKYFYHFYNILDCTVIILSIVGIGFNVFRSIHVDELLDKILKNSNSTVEDQYANFEMIGFWQTRYNDMAAIVVFVAWFKVFKYISFNKTMTQLNETLAKCAKDIMGFLVMFLIVFVAFMQWGFLLFGTQVKDFSTVGDSFFTLFRIILGDFDFEAIENANRILGPFYFLVFVFFVFFVLLNMFLAIINDTYGAVKDELAERKNEFEISDYFKKGYMKMKDKLSFKREKIVDIQEALEVADANQDEGISFDEMKMQLKERGHTDDEIETLFSKYDKDSNRILTKEEQEKMKADLKEEKADVEEDLAAVDKAEETRAAADAARAEMDEDSDGDDVRRALRVRGSHAGGVALGGVAYEEFTVLSRRVDRVEHSIGTIVHKVDSVLLKLEMLDKGKSKRRETITKLLSTVSEEDKEILLGKDKKRTIEEITREDYNETGGSRSSLRSGNGSPNNVTYRGTGSNQQV